MSVFTNVSKNTSTYTNVSKNTSIYTNVDKVTGTGLWSSATIPWQLSLPWQFIG